MTGKQTPRGGAHPVIITIDNPAGLLYTVFR